VPHDDELKAAKLEEARAPEPVAEEPPPPPAPVEEDAEVLLGAAPKKANWDLRRDVAKKLEKLDKRTQARCILHKRPCAHAQAQRALVDLARQEEKSRLALS